MAPPFSLPTKRPVLKGRPFACHARRRRCRLKANRKEKTSRYPSRSPSRVMVLLRLVCPRNGFAVLHCVAALPTNSGFANRADPGARTSQSCAGGPRDGAAMGAASSGGHDHEPKRRKTPRGHLCAHHRSHRCRARARRSSMDAAMDCCQHRRLYHSAAPSQRPTL